MLTPEGFDYTPPKSRSVSVSSSRHSMRPVTTRDLNLLYNSMSATIKALEKRGVVVVEGAALGVVQRADHAVLGERQGPGSYQRLNAQALAQIERARLMPRRRGPCRRRHRLRQNRGLPSAIERVLAAGRSACVLVPEIADGPDRRPLPLALWRDGRRFHSRLSAGERLDQWDMVASGAARVVVGPAFGALFARSAILGLIIIDEEHETSYKQGSSPRYHAREVAAEMARRYRCPLVLGSATPRPRPSTAAAAAR
ncbi:MAG: hypothetical protein ACLU0O_09855 [Collinsella sp.]